MALKYVLQRMFQRSPNVGYTLKKELIDSFCSSASVSTPNGANAGMQVPSGVILH